MENKIKHLEFIQDAIKRMAGNSFLLRGWSVTLVIAVLTLASQSFKTIYLWLALFVIIIFWTLDSYYLFQERKFRCLYDEVRKKSENDIDFSMKLQTCNCGQCKWSSTIKFSGFIMFYGLTTLVLLIALAMNYLNITITIK